MPSSSASPRATVDLPAPAGPSIAITMRHKPRTARALFRASPHSIPDRLAAVKAWNVADMEVEPHHPLVLDSSEEGRLIVIELPAGEEMQEHRVHERAWLVVARGAIEIDDADGETVGGGPGMVAEFNPNELRTVRATEHSRIVLLLSPWPGEGHPSQT